jgi:hypothetical protein
MTFTVSFGWWLAPALVTALAFAWSYTKQDRSPAYDYGRIGQGIGNAVLHGMALIVSLIAWLIWAVLT